MDPLESKIIKLYDKEVSLQDIGRPLGLKTGEIVKIICKYKTGIVDKGQIISLFKQGIKMFPIAKQLNIPHFEVVRVLNGYRKKEKTYNKGKFGGYANKNKLDKEFVKFLSLNSILDVYAGDGKKYPKEITTTNDIDKKCKTAYHLDAIELLTNSAIEGYKFDLVDLDPYRSCWRGWKDAIDIAQKGIVISYGDLTVWRYHYQDKEFWNPILGSYNNYIDTIHDLKYALISRTIEIGKELDKQLHIWNVFSTWQFLRVYYVIR